jgi:PAS domain-containing protein
MKHTHYHWRQFGVGIVFPAILVMTLFILAIFGVVTPTVETAIIERKKEMIRELTVAAWGILSEYGRQEQASLLSREQAQQRALTEIRHLRYGGEGKDYFWISDLRPIMVMHPYRAELDGTDVSGYRDAAGEPVFAKFVRIVRAQGEGYAAYQWQWKDDPERVEPKLSFVKLYEPWGWIIGTGVYLDDVRMEIRRLTGRLTRISMAIAAVLAVLLFVIGRQSYGIERRRRKAEQELRESEARYRMLVESAAEGILLAADQRILFCNKPALALLSLPESACLGRPVLELLAQGHPGSATLAEWLNTGTGAARFDALLLRHGQNPVPVALAVSPVSVSGKTGLLVSIREYHNEEKHEVSPPLGALLALIGASGIEELLTQTVTLPGQGKGSCQVSYQDLLKQDGASLPLLIRQVREAETATALQQLCAIATASARMLLVTGVKAGHITGFLATLCDAVIVRLIALAERELGPPPVPYAFLALGSTGRREQTLATDQDNALVYADPAPDIASACEAYFHSLASRVCEGLDAAGYAYCRGEVMARNPKWCRPISQWRCLFDEWLEKSSVEALQAVNIVFDFRHAAGDESLSEELRKHVQRDIASRETFFFNLAGSTLEFKPPLGLFGKIVVESSGRHPETFDIKSGLVPIVNFARVYALRHAVPAVGTLDRIHLLVAAGVLQPASAAELEMAFEMLSLWRLRHQAIQLASDQPADNHVHPAELTEIEQAALRKIFEQIHLFQSRIRLDFTGSL